jgi:hypothetical protein
VALLSTYDPPARLSDFDAIAGQRDAWHRFVLESFNQNIQTVRDQLRSSNGQQTGRPQFYSAVSYDPGGPLIEQAVVWNAFPKELLRRYGRARALVEADRLWPLSAYQYDWHYDPDVPADTGVGTAGIDLPDTYGYRPTVEYCEWHVDRDAASGRISKVTFTSEPPEYWQAMFGGTLDGSSVPFPGDKDLVLDLYRKLVSPHVEMADLLVKAPLKSPFGSLNPGDYNPHNKWNTTHGIVHLSAPPNALTAEINLAALATVLYEDNAGKPVVDPDAFIAGTGMGGANRNSDPTIAATVNVLARQGAMITLANPVGLYMDHIDLAGWDVPGGTSASDWVRIVRGEKRLIERLVIEAPSDEFDVSDIRIGGVSVAYGGQIAECITVKLIGVAAALNSVKNGRLKLPTAGFVDPANAREVFVAGRRGNQQPTGTIPAFIYESGEAVVQKLSIRPGESIVTARRHTR